MYITDKIMNISGFEKHWRLAIRCSLVKINSFVRFREL